MDDFFAEKSTRYAQSTGQKGAFRLETTLREGSKIVGMELTQIHSKSSAPLSRAQQKR